MNTLGERIKKARENLGISQAELANLIEVKASSGVISNWERDLNKPDAEKIIKLCEVLKVSASYLLDYYGNSEFQCTISEQEHIKKLRALDAYGKKAVNSVLDIEYERCNYEAEIAEEPMTYIPRVYYSQGASAGYGEYLIDGMDASEIMLPDTPKNRKSDYVINVDGDSMEPTFSDGDKLLVQHTESVNVGEIGIFIIDGQSYVKEFGEDRLISHNPKYPDIIPSEYSDFRCVGKVIGVMK